MNIVEGISPPPTIVPPASMIPQDFKADKIIGVIVMVFSGLTALGGLIVILMGYMVAGPTNNIVSQDAMAPRAKGEPDLLQNGPFQSLPIFHLPAIFGAVGLIVVAIATLQLVAGIGVFKGSRNGLILGLVIAVLSTLSGGLGIMTGLALGLYVILRLWGNVGPRPA